MQSRHYGDYAKTIADLLERGLAYPCTLTRSELKTGARTNPETALSPDSYLGIFTNADATPKAKPSLPYAIRINLKKALSIIGTAPLTFTETGSGETRIINAAEPLTGWAASDRPDPIIARKDIGVSYHIAVTHDDYLQGIIHVVRGMDLFEETPLHVLIQTLMEWPIPIYHHHALLKREDGEKLSKRGLDTSLESLRENGLTAAQVLAMASA